MVVLWLPISSNFAVKNAKSASDGGRLVWFGGELNQKMGGL